MFRSCGQKIKIQGGGGLRTASFSLLPLAFVLSAALLFPAGRGTAEESDPQVPAVPAQPAPATQPSVSPESTAPAPPPAPGDQETPGESKSPPVGPDPLLVPSPPSVKEDAEGAAPAPNPAPPPPPGPENRENPSAPSSPADPTTSDPEDSAPAPAASEGNSSSASTTIAVAGLPPYPTDPRQIRFTAWNLKNYLHVAAPPPAGSTEKSKPPRETAAVTALLVRIHPDILGVCEMGSAADLAVLQADLKKAGLDLPNAEWVEGADPSRHLALLTRFPIASRQPVTDLRYVLDDSQFPVQRGFLDVTVQVNADYALRLIGTHLKSRLDVPEADQELMRRNEAALLRQHLDTVLTAAPDANVLVYGDFNDSRDQPSVKAVKGIRGAAAALSEIPAEDDSGERWTFYYPTADEYSRIDFLLASSGLMPEVRKGQAFLPGGSDWSRASDHRPVTLDLMADDAATSRSRSSSKAKSKPKPRPKEVTSP